MITIKKFMFRITKVQMCYTGSDEKITKNILNKLNHIGVKLGKKVIFNNKTKKIVNTMFDYQKAINKKIPVYNK